MTLEELINSHKEVIKYSEKMKSLAVNTDDINRLIKQHTQELEYLEELKTLRVELEKNSKELEVYKKALKLTCDELFRINNFCIGTDFYKTCVASRINCKDCWKEYYLQQAREQSDV